MRYRGKARKSGKKTVKKAIRTAKKSNFVKAVKAVIHQQEETKQAFYRLNNAETLVNFNSYITTASDMCQVIPNIARGTANNERIADEIISQKLQLRGHIRYTPTTVIDAPGRGNIAVRLMVVSSKIRPNFPDVQGSTSPLSQLLKKGGSTSAFTGILSDLYAPINSELWTKHFNKVYYLNQPINIRGAGALSSGYQDLQNIIKFFKIDIKLKKKLYYDSNINNGNTPTNAGPVLLMGYVYLNAADGDFTDTNVSMYYCSELSYEG